MVEAILNDEKNQLTITVDIDPKLATLSNSKNSILVVPPVWITVPDCPLKFNFCLIAPLGWEKNENAELRFEALPYDQWKAEYGAKKQDYV